MFIRGPNPIWYLPDLTGSPLNDEYYAFFLTNTLPYLPQNVYRDPQGLTVWTGDIIQFLPNGTLPNNLYFDPSLTYRIEVRHGDTQHDQLIYEINNYVPGIEGESPTITTFPILFASNQITNGQFSDISFVSPLSISSAGTYEIAPGWELILVGAGTTTVTQLIFFGAELSPTTPAFPFSIQIDNNGWTTATLRQTLTNNGAIFANGAVSMSITARAEGTSEPISLLYNPESPGSPILLATSTLTTGDYVQITGTQNTNASTNTNLSNVSFVNMDIILPTTGIVDITNVQVTGQSEPIPAGIDPAVIVPDYQQETQERMDDHLFHFYKPSLILKPKRSILTGWNFPLNPYQFITTTVTTITAQTSYVADQTILHQEAASQLKTGQNSAANNYNFLVKAVTAATTTRFALIQYIDPATIVPYWNNLMSSLARVNINTSHGTQVRLKARLIWRTTLPSTIGNTEPIASWSANSDPTFSAGWTPVAPQNDPAYILGDSAYTDFSFNSFQMPAASTVTMTLGLVIYTMDNLNSTSGSEDSIGFEEISLIPSEFAADAFPQTYDESLKQCEFYYEKSYDDGVLPAATTAHGVQIYQQFVGSTMANNTLIARAFNLNYKRTKRLAPVITIYSYSAGTTNSVTGFIRNAGSASATGAIAFSTNWTVQQTGFNSSYYIAANDNDLLTDAAGSDTNAEAFIAFQYTLDSRLGI